MYNTIFKKLESNFPKMLWIKILSMSLLLWSICSKTEKYAKWVCCVMPPGNHNGDNG